MTAEPHVDEPRTERMRSPLAAATILLGIYTVIYLAVAGIFHILKSPDDAALVSEGVAASAERATNVATDRNQSLSVRHGDQSVDGYSVHPAD